VPYLERKNTEEPTGELEQGVDGLDEKRNPRLDGLDGLDDEPQIRGGEKPGEGHGGGRPR